MATNFYLQSGIPGGRTSEQRLIESLIIEAIKFYGFDVYYLSRSEGNIDEIFQEDTTSKFENAIPLEAYLENVDGYGGNGDLMSKFGIEIKDTATFVVARQRWDDVVARGRQSSIPLPNRPAEGDILYMPMTGSYFEVKRVEAQDPFYQLGKLYVYKLQCELYQYSSEEFNTGIQAVDQIEEQRSMDVERYNFMLENNQDRLVLETNIITDDDYLILENGMANIQEYDPLADNDRFNDEATDILDFSEINPFGEVARR